MGDPQGQRHRPRPAADRADLVTILALQAGAILACDFSVLADAGIRTVLCNGATPRRNAIADRWIGGCRRELLDRALVWNQAHMRRILREYEIHHISTGRTAPCTAPLL